MASDSVDCDRAFEKGVAAIGEIEGKRFNDVHLKRKSCVKTLATVIKSVSVRNDLISVNPNQLLHRMVCTLNTDAQLKELFKYELCAYPPSLFNESGMMRKGTKSSVVDVLVGKVTEPTTEVSAPQIGVRYVIDGGHLLHRVAWQRPATFQSICQQHVAYVLAHYGKQTVVFDGYSTLNTKDEEHLHRSGKISHVNVVVEDHITITLQQDEFLTNATNKMRFISLLKTHLQAAGCTVLQAEGDADILIVSTAIAEAQRGGETIVIGEDTDLLVLLLTLAPDDSHLKMILPGKKNQPHKIHLKNCHSTSVGRIEEYFTYCIRLHGMRYYIIHLSKR